MSCAPAQKPTALSSAERFLAGKNAQLGNTAHRLCPAMRPEASIALLSAHALARASSQALDNSLHGQRLRLPAA